MYTLGRRSRRLLEGLHPDLVRVVERAIEITGVDFTVTEGLRSVERQAELVAAKASWTMKSRHITGHAVDLAAWVARSVRWDWPLYFELALAMRQASTELSVPIKWGGVWDKPMHELGEDMEKEMHDYAVRFKRRSKGKRPLQDGPHFHLTRADYPADG